MPARNVLGDHTCAVALVQSMFLIPTAAAVRNRVPTLPLSCTSFKIKQSSLIIDKLGVGTLMIAMISIPVPKLRMLSYSEFDNVKIGV